MKILKKYSYIALRILVLTLIYTLLFSLSYERWGDLIVDSFRDAWVGLKLSQGSVLYQDVRYLMGPLIPYAFSLFFKFGSYYPYRKTNRHIRGILFWL